MSVLMPQQLLNAALEKILNQALSLNIKNNDALMALQGNTLSILLSELGFPICLTFTDKSVAEKLILVHGNIESADCKISTSLNTLWQVKREQSITELIKQNELDVQGDLKVAQQVAALFENIQIDWGSELAKHIGDIPTYQLSQLVTHIKNKAQFASQQISADASEWLIHEKKLIVTENELAIFNQAVNKLAINTEQLAQRIERLTKNTSNNT